MKVIIFIIACFIAQNAYAAEPIAKVGSGCPYGYHSNGDYCIPNPIAPVVIPKTGDNCPYGFHEDGNYCVKN